MRGTSSAPEAGLGHEDDDRKLSLLGTRRKLLSGQGSLFVLEGQHRDLVQGLCPQAALRGCCIVRWTDFQGKKKLL